MGKRFVECFLVRRKKRFTLMEENENAKRLSLSGTLKRPEPTSQSRFSFASWLMVITDDFENSSTSLFPYDQYEMSKSIYAIAAITLN